jgi:hypothetical protein
MIVIYTIRSSWNSCKLNDRLRCSRAVRFPRVLGGGEEKLNDRNTATGSATRVPVRGLDPAAPAPTPAPAPAEPAPAPKSLRAVVKLAAAVPAPRDDALAELLAEPLPLEAPLLLPLLLPSMVGLAASTSPRPRRPPLPTAPPGLRLTTAAGDDTEASPPLPLVTLPLPPELALEAGFAPKLRPLP